MRKRLTIKRILISSIIGVLICCAVFFSCFFSATEVNSSRIQHINDTISHKLVLCIYGVDEKLITSNILSTDMPNKKIVEDARSSFMTATMPYFKEGEGVLFYFGWADVTHISYHPINSMFDFLIFCADSHEITHWSFPHRIRRDANIIYREYGEKKASNEITWIRESAYKTLDQCVNSLTYRIVEEVSILGEDSLKNAIILPSKNLDKLPPPIREAILKQMAEKYGAYEKTPISKKEFQITLPPDLEYLRSEVEKIIKKTKERTSQLEGASNIADLRDEINNFIKSKNLETTEFHTKLSDTEEKGNEGTDYSLTQPTR